MTNFSNSDIYNFETYLKFWTAQTIIKSSRLNRLISMFESKINNVMYIVPLIPLPDHMQKGICCLENVFDVKRVPIRQSVQCGKKWLWNEVGDVMVFMPASPFVGKKVLEPSESSE